MRDRKKGGFLLAAGGIFAAVSVFVKDSYYANILRSWGIAWVVIGLLRLREYFYYKSRSIRRNMKKKKRRRASIGRMSGRCFCGRWQGIRHIR